MSAITPFRVRKAAVLGAGVMGAQIAAHLVNANVATLLFELPAQEGDPNGAARQAIDGLKKLEPGPLSVLSRAGHIAAANYAQHLELLNACDLVIEAIAERADGKAEFYARIAPHLAGHAVLASNTSGLSINTLSESLPEILRQRFCGIHFFNPPRYMHLVEIIAARDTDRALLDQVETFLVTTLGKGVVRAKDTPGFIANRIGVFALLAAIHHAARLGLACDVVDALTGPAIGRPRSATFRTADLAGLDTLARVVGTMAGALPDDPWRQHFKLPSWLTRLIDDGALGQKTGRGVYRKADGDIHVFDQSAADYRPLAAAIDPAVARVLAVPQAGERLGQLRLLDHPQAQFVWAVLRDTLHYCAAHLEEIADSARDVDLAMRWGFGWNEGPFETWQAAGWRRVTDWIEAEVRSGEGMAAVPLPSWAQEPGRTGVHAPTGSYAPARAVYAPRSALPVYRRQLFPDRLSGEPVQYGRSVFESDAVRCWHVADDVAIVSFKTKMHTIGGAVLDGLLAAIDAAERGFAALVIWQTEPPFSAGADLRAAGGPSEIERLLGHFQLAAQRLRYSLVPTVAAVDGLALGGGCELLMHCDRTVASLESYIGLVEAAIGLVPAGGGCKELALRAVREARGGDLFPFLRRCFEAVATAQVSRSAEDARELGYLRPADRVVMNRFEVLSVALTEARSLAEAGYRPPLQPVDIAVAGRPAIAMIKAQLTNLREGGYISPHDFLVASRIGEVLCGGDVEAGSLVDEGWLLDLERRHFMELIATPQTQARIEHMLKTGKPLRN